MAGLSDLPHPACPHQPVGSTAVPRSLLAVDGGGTAVPHSLLAVGWWETAVSLLQFSQNH
ncbi:MAG: hypothetical protein H6661_06855 [Ardenticatenaceae bacterium]|nr:hypothetical protein [Ardenticatenaceae bacterium]